MNWLLLLLPAFVVLIGEGPLACKGGSYVGSLVGVVVAILLFLKFKKHRFFKVQVYMMTALLLIALSFALFQSVLADRCYRPPLHREAQIKLNEIGKYLDMYRADCGAFPSTEQGLQALVQVPLDSKCKDWGPNPYLESVPIDPWNHPFKYAFEHSRVIIRSNGPDGQTGGKYSQDDIIEGSRVEGINVETKKVVTVEKQITHPDCEASSATLQRLGVKLKSESMQDSCPVGSVIDTQKTDKNENLPYSKISTTCDRGVLKLQLKARYLCVSYIHPNINELLKSENVKRFKAEAEVKITTDDSCLMDFSNLYKVANSSIELETQAQKSCPSGDLVFLKNSITWKPLSCEKGQAKFWQSGEFLCLN